MKPHRWKVEPNGREAICTRCGCYRYKRKVLMRDLYGRLQVVYGRRYRTETRYARRGEDFGTDRPECEQEDE